MWQGLGNCYYKLKRHQEAIKSFKRALLSDSTDSGILISLAEIYIAKADTSTAEIYYRQCLREEQDEYSMPGSKAALWLATLEVSRSNWPEAEKCADYGLKGPYEQEAFKSIKRVVQNGLQNIGNGQE